MAKDKNIDAAPKSAETVIHTETKVEDHTHAPVDEIEIECEQTSEEIDEHGTILVTIGEPVEGFPEPAEEPEADADEEEAE